MLAIKHSAKLFYRIDIQKLQGIDKESKEVIGRINSTWSDIEYLNYFFHKNFGRLSDDPEISMTFSALLVFSDSFYVHMSTLYLLLKQLGEKHKNVKRLLSMNKAFFTRIQVIRNNILIHKEKPDFKNPRGSMSATDPSHLIEHRVLVIEKDGSQKVYTLKPLLDIYKMSRLLENAGNLLLSEQERLGR